MPRLWLESLRDFAQPLGTRVAGHVQVLRVAIRVEARTFSGGHGHVLVPEICNQQIGGAVHAQGCSGARRGQRRER